MVYHDGESRPHAHAHATTTTIVASPTALHKAADVNDAATVKALLRGGAVDPNARVACRNCDEGATALHLAAQKGHLEPVLALLEAGARPDGRDAGVVGHDRQPNKIWAYSSDESDSSSGSGSSSSYASDPDVLSEHPLGVEWDGDLTPLHLACAGGHTAVVRALLSAGERTDRMASSRRVHGLDIMELQHDDRSDDAAPRVGDLSGEIGIRAVAPFPGVEVGRGGGHTPLHLASACGAAGAVRALLEAGASVHLRARDVDDTPLHLASASGHLEVMAVLLEAGADVNVGDEIGNTPLHVAHDVQALEFLLARGANPNLVARSRYGTGSPLGSYCTLIHRRETDAKGMARATAKVEALLRHGANVHTRDTSSSCDEGLDGDDDEESSPSSPSSGRDSAAQPASASPILSCAAKNGVPGIVSALLGAGLNPNERDRDGWAPIHDAAKGNHVDVLRLLLRAGAVRDAPTDRGRWTPLHLACRYTSVECVLELLRWGAALGPTARPGPRTGKRRRGGGAPPHRVYRRTCGEVDGGWVNDARHDDAAAVSLASADRPGGEFDEEENGYGKAPAQVIGLRNISPAATVPSGSGGGGGGGGSGSGPGADPSQDEEEDQMVVLGGGDDGGSREWSTGVRERNAIRRALRQEAAWRRRRSVVLLKVHLDKRRREWKASSSVVDEEGRVGPPQPQPQPQPLPTCGACGGGGGNVSSLRVERGWRTCGASNEPPAAKIAKPTLGGGGSTGGIEVDGFQFLRRTLEGVVNLAGHEEALYQHVVTFL